MGGGLSQEGRRNTRGKAVSGTRRGPCTNATVAAKPDTVQPPDRRLRWSTYRPWASLTSPAERPQEKVIPVFATTMSRSTFVLPVALGLGLGALSLPAAAVEPGAPDRLISAEEAVSARLLRRLADEGRSLKGREHEESRGLAAFYAARHGKMVWVSRTGLNKRALAAMDEIARADDYGLRARDFTLPDRSLAEPGTVLDPDRMIEVELTLSRAVLKYIRHARGGRVEPRKISRNLDYDLNLPDPVKVMERMVGADDPAAVLRDYHPKHPQFERLRQALLARRGSSEPGVAKVRLPNGPALKPGMRHAQVALLRKRLGLPVRMNLSTPSADPERYDEALLKAVRAFQKKRGLTPDGIVGPSTRRALNGESRAATIQKIIVNMERWRWMPEKLGKFYVNVNIPEQIIRVYRNGKPFHTERVVVGKPSKATPVFSDQMEFIVFHPFWNVPNSIKREEILPYLKRSTTSSFWGGGGRPRVLVRNNLYVKLNGRKIDASKVDWSRVDIRRYHFYQPPGGKNVLGFVKFMFPNKHSVYMHDTPQRHLFNQPVRAESHGCMRIRNPRRLAEILLAHDRGWPPATIGRLIAAGKNHRVNLKNPIPVHITYFTAWVDDQGRLRSYGDIYGHDRRVARALDGKVLLVSNAGARAPRAKHRRNRYAQRERQQSSAEFFRRLFQDF